MTSESQEEKPLLPENQLDERAKQLQRLGTLVCLLSVVLFGHLADLPRTVDLRLQRGFRTANIYHVLVAC